MSVSSQVVFDFSSEKQFDAIESFQYQLVGRGFEHKAFKDIAVINRKALTCTFSNCFCWTDFKDSLPEFSLHIASSVPSSNFNCYEARFENEVDGTITQYEFMYNGSGLLDVHYVLSEPFEDEYEEYFNYSLIDGKWVKEEG